MNNVAPTAPKVECLDFLWLELTSRCNLSCVHCYSDSSPKADTSEDLSLRELTTIIEAAAQLGCRKIQFIGGEPTLVHNLTNLIDHARLRNFEFIEVFTNALRISEELLTCLVNYHVHVAISFYSFDPQIHDSITAVRGSHKSTLMNLRRLVAAGIFVRAGIVIMPENEATAEETKRFLASEGVNEVGVDHRRAVGRGAVYSLTTTNNEDMSELCGNCWRGSLCISSRGIAYPCIMSRRWPIGSIRSLTLQEILRSPLLHKFRETMYEGSTNASREVSACDPHGCDPRCPPHCSPACTPQHGCQPNQCWPKYD